MITTREILGLIVLVGGAAFATWFFLRLRKETKHTGPDKDYAVRPCVCGKFRGHTLRADNNSLGRGGAVFFIICLVPGFLVLLSGEPRPASSSDSLGWGAYVVILCLAAMTIIPALNFAIKRHSLKCTLRRGLLGLMFV
jgi:hypothetical protein